MVVDLQHEVHYLNNQLHPLLDEEEEDPKMFDEDVLCLSGHQGLLAGILYHLHGSVFIGTKRQQVRLDGTPTKLM